MRLINILKQGNYRLQIMAYPGIPVFNISRMATKGTLIHIDFIPDYSINDIVEYWAKHLITILKIQLGTVMDGMLNTKITAVMLEKACINIIVCLESYI